MENQHRKISGYRELTTAEIDLMNRIKAKGAELLALQKELAEALVKQRAEKAENCLKAGAAGREACDELVRFDAAEPLCWAALGKTDIQTGVMALVRAVAQPTD